MRNQRLIPATALITVLVSILPAGATGVRYLDPIFEPAPAQTLEYGRAVDNHGVEIGLLLDLYEPAADTAPARPAILFAHGGGFTGGTRDDTQIVALAQEFARRGYVTASIGYRIRPSGTPGSPTMQDLIVGSLAGQLPAAMHDAQRDMQAAVRWLRANASAYRVDADRIAAGGISAGASMALETAYNPDDDGDDGPVPSNIAAAVSVSGATDPRRIEMSSPPVAMFNGTHDTTAPYPTALMACGAATALLNVCTLTTYPGSGHDLMSEHQAQIIGEAAAFLCLHLGLGCI